MPALLGWGVHQPLIFVPTAYGRVEQPQIRGAKVYNIIVGHLVGLGTGFLSVFLLNAWSEPNVLLTGSVSGARLRAAIIAVTLTTFFTLLLKAGQPAALATTLLVSLGSMQTKRDALAIIAGVLIVTAFGEPVRRFRLKHSVLRPVLEKRAD